VTTAENFSTILMLCFSVYILDVYVKNPQNRPSHKKRALDEKRLARGTVKISKIPLNTRDSIFNT